MEGGGRRKKKPHKRTLKNLRALQECAILASKLWRRISVGRKIRGSDPRKIDDNQKVI